MADNTEHGLLSTRNKKLAPTDMINAPVVAGDHVGK
jgi:hypothetical protein